MTLEDRGRIECEREVRDYGHAASLLSGTITTVYRHLGGVKRSCAPPAPPIPASSPAAAWRRLPRCAAPSPILCVRPGACQSLSLYRATGVTDRAPTLDDGEGHDYGLVWVLELLAHDPIVAEVTRFRVWAGPGILPPPHLVQPYRPASCRAGCDSEPRKPL